MLLYNWVKGVPGYVITQGLPQGPVAGIAKEQFTKKEDSGYKGRTWQRETITGERQLVA